jgi:hypothetical protein
MGNRKTAESAVMSILANQKIMSNEKLKESFEGVLRLTSRKLQDFLSFKKSVPEKLYF